MKPLTQLMTEYIDFKMENLEKKIDILPTKDEFFTWMDKLVLEQQKTRDEVMFLIQRVKRIETVNRS